MGRKPKPKILKVNKYENPQMALNLIAHIMTSSADMSVEDDFNKWDDYYKSFEQRFRDQSNLEDDEYHDSFVESSIDNIVYRLHFPSLLLPEKLEETNGRKSITVAVCGGYSSRVMTKFKGFEVLGRYYMSGNLNTNHLITFPGLNWV